MKNPSNDSSTINSTDDDIHEMSELQYLDRRKKRMFLFLSIMSITVVPLFIVIIFNAERFFNREDRIGSLIATLAISYGIMVILFYSFSYRSAAMKYEDAKQRIYLRKQLNLFPDIENYKPSAESYDKEDKKYFEKLVAINVENLSTYYIQVKEHANKGFLASITMGILGFMLLSSSLVYGFSNNASNAALTYSAFASGLVIEFISAIFFYIHNKTVIQMKAYHDSLLYVQNILLSLKLLEGIEDSATKDKTTTQIVEYLVKKQTD